MTLRDHIKQVDEYPLPFDRDEMITMQKESIKGKPSPGPNSEEDIIKSVDAFHEQYRKTLHDEDDWMVFEPAAWISTGWIYFWNREGWGFKVKSDWETLVPIVEIMDSFTEEFSSDDFEPNQYLWELP